MQNLQKKMENTMRCLPEGTPLLLHACCAPCSTTALAQLCGHFDVTLLYYNPNIAPREEYKLRFAQLEKLLEEMPLERPPKLLEGAWEHDRFLEAVRGLEEQPEGGVRCEVCFRVRLGEAARFAAAQDIGWMATTLSASPHKNAALLWQLGGEAAGRQGIRCLPCDFKKQDGARQSVQLSARYGLYRQNYCGCEFAKRAQQL